MAPAETRGLQQVNSSEEKHHDQVTSGAAVESSSSAAPEVATEERAEPESLEYSVRPDSIQGRSGNFLFTVGNPSSGKSTLQNYLVYSLFNDLTVQLNSEHRDGDRTQDVYLNDWVKNIQKGFLPRRSQQGRLQEFTITIEQAGRAKLSFTFIEISGEDIRSIVPDRDNGTPGLHADLEQFLRLPRANRRFIFVSDATTKGASGAGSVLDEDILFTHLIQHLLGRKGINLRRLNILFVASKWDQVNNDYRSPKAYFDKYFTQTRAVVQNSRRIRATYIPFSVGNVVVSSDGSQSVTRIRSFDDRYVRYLISWIYFNFTGRHLKHYPRAARSIWERFKDVFA